ncbi:MAG: diaminopimelate decarboxylase [Candidatus Hydrothermarchaeota archaeon]|nr:MAG: diaminopimelate decarboxylase [Candidatus Hydrothermarchaeota archaeon]
MREHLGSKGEHLTIGNVDVVELVDRFGTPLYVIDEQRVRQRYGEFYQAFAKAYPRVKVMYSYKANTSLAVLHILRQEGAGADVVSGGELYLALQVGLKPKDIMFTGNNKTNEELELAVDSEVIINLDSIHEIHRLERICKEKGKKVEISFRVNPAISPETHPHLATGLRESKFGIQESEVLQAYKLANSSEYLEIKGIHMHIGSQITSTKPYEEAVEKLLDLVGMLKDNGIELSFIDIGGGVGIRYKKESKYITPEELASAIVPIIKNKIKEYSLRTPSLFLEPGRYIVGDAGILLTRVTTIKQGFKKFVGIDAGFNVLMRPVLYQAYHEVIVANKVNAKAKEKVDIAGNICESGDILARDRELPEVEEGDIIAFLDAGAYGIVMASRYNSRPLPAEVLVNNGKYEVIRERESYNDLISRQRIPSRLLGGKK